MRPTSGDLYLVGPSDVTVAGLASISVTLALGTIVLLAALWALAERTRRRADAQPTLGEAILVPVARPRSAFGLVGFAAAIAAEDRGRLVAVNVIGADADRQGRIGAETLVQATEVVAADQGCEVSTLVRASRTVADGVLHTAVEHAATLVVVGWPSEGRHERDLGCPVDRIVAEAPAPVIVTRLDGGDWQRVVLRGVDVRRRGGRPSLRLAAAVARRIAAYRHVPLTCTSDLDRPEVRQLLAGVEQVEPADEQLGDPEVLTIAAVPPGTQALERAVARMRGIGDVALVLSHGAVAEHHRPLLPTAQRLLDERPGVEPTR